MVAFADGKRRVPAAGRPRGQASRSRSGTPHRSASGMPSAGVALRRKEGCPAGSAGTGNRAEGRCEGVHNQGNPDSIRRMGGGRAVECARGAMECHGRSLCHKNPPLAARKSRQVVASMVTFRRLFKNPVVQTSWNLPAAPDLRRVLKPSTFQSRLPSADGSRIAAPASSYKRRPDIRDAREIMAHDAVPILLWASRPSVGKLR